MGAAAWVSFLLHADRTALHEAGLIEIGIGSSPADLRLLGELELSGPERLVGAARVLTTPVTVRDL